MRARSQSVSQYENFTKLRVAARKHVAVLSASIIIGPGSGPVIGMDGVVINHHDKYCIILWRQCRPLRPHQLEFDIELSSGYAAKSRPASREHGWRRKGSREADRRRHTSAILTSAAVRSNSKCDMKLFSLEYAVHDLPLNTFSPLCFS